MLRTALLVAGKDLRQRLRDRSALVIAFVAPFVLASIIGLAFGGDTAFRVTYAVADADRGPVAAGFTDGVLASPGLRDLVTVRRVEPGQARALVDGSQVDAAFLLPAGLSAAVRQGRPATLSVVSSGENPVAGQVARSLAEAYAAELAATRLAVATALDAGGRAPRTPPDAAEARRLGERAAAQAQPVRLVEGRTGGRTIEAANYFGPSMAIFFLFFTVSFGARSILTERRQGTLRRLLASAAPPRRGPGRQGPGRVHPRHGQHAGHVAGDHAGVRGRLGRPGGRPAPHGDLRPGRHRGRHAGWLGAAQRRAGHLHRPSGRHRPRHARRLHVAAGHRPRAHARRRPPVPHAWAMDAFIALIACNSGLGGIVRELAVLAAFAAVLLGVATRRLRRTLVG